MQVPVPRVSALFVVIARSVNVPVFLILKDNVEVASSVLHEQMSERSGERIF